MTTIDLNKEYSATYTVEKAGSGYEGTGRIWKKGKDGKQISTDIRFRAAGNTQQAAINATQKEAARVCPDE
jgi:hypothetical protein